MKKLWGIGHAIRATDRAMDWLHGAYERAIHWIFSTRRWKRWVVWVYAHSFNADSTRDKASKRHWRSATITPRGVVAWSGVLSFVIALGLAPLVGSEFVPETDQGFTQLALRMPVGSSLERTDAKVKQIEEIVSMLP
jgi:hypothetical protein